MRIPTMRCAARLILVLLGVWLLSGCSGVHLAYSQIDRLVDWRLGDYVSLSAGQRDWFAGRMKQHRAWHCATQLPQYTRWLRMLEAVAGEPAPRVELISLHLGRLEAFALELSTELAPTGADLLLRLEPEQREELFEGLHSRLQETRGRLLEQHPEQRTRERAQRMERRLWRWMGVMTAQQSERIQQWSRVVDDLDNGWLQSRALLYDEIQSHLDEPESEAARGHLINALQFPLAARTDSHREQQDRARREAIVLAADLLGMATAEQRARLRGRLASLAADFDALACEPAVRPS